MLENNLIARLTRGEEIKKGDVEFLFMHQYSQEAFKITSRINGRYHKPKKVRKLMSKLFGYTLDDGFTLFPPFYTDNGKNTHIGKNVFINASCCFQDQGGIYIGDNCLIGHQVIIATLNHNLNPKQRANLKPKSVHIGNNVWIGSGSILLPGVHIGDNSVIGAGSLVNRDIDSNCIAVGNPIRIIREIGGDENE